jgi:hypothetical protein
MKIIKMKSITRTMMQSIDCIDADMIDDDLIIDHVSNPPVSKIVL